MTIPSKVQWPAGGPDEAYAFRNFFGKSQEEATLLFKQCAIVFQEDLTYMPEIPFKFYFPSYVSYLLSDDSEGDSDGASCFLSVVRYTLNYSPHWLDELWSDVEKVLTKIEAGQEFYSASEEIYGSFPERVVDLRLYHVRQSS